MGDRKIAAGGELFVFASREDIKMKLKNLYNGFIQIPMLIGIIISMIAVTGVGYGVVEYKKTSDLVNNAKQLSVDKKYKEANEKLESVKNKWFVKTLGIQEEKITNEIENNKAKLDVEAAMQEIEKVKQEAQQIIDDQQKKEATKTEVQKTKANVRQGASAVSATPSTQPVVSSATPAAENPWPELKIEKCKSEYAAKKSEMITQYDNFELPKTRLLFERVAQDNYQKCMIDCLEMTRNKLGLSFLSPELSASVSDTCRRFVCSDWVSYATRLTGMARDSQLDKIEQQLQVEYQQCLAQ